MFNISAIASSVLESIDNVAKESLEEKRISATAIRSRRKANNTSDVTETERATLSEKNLQEIHLNDNRIDHSSLNNHNDNDSHQSGNSGKTQESYIIPPSPRSSIDNSVTNEGVEVIEKPNNSVSKSSTGLGNILSGKVSMLSSSRLNENVDGKEDEVKRLLKKKNQEIESLNAECLELEEQNSSLKREVQEAWDHYKQSQERAAFREAELIDEVKQVQKAKQQEKQQSVAQVTKLGEEITSLSKQIQSYHIERVELTEKVEMVDKVIEEWKLRVDELEAEIVDLQQNNSKGVHAVRDELAAKDHQMEQMRQDHITILRQNQTRQSQLERENADLNKAIAEYEMELQRLRAHNNHSGMSNTNGSVAMEEHMTVQRELLVASSKLEKEQERAAEVDRQLWSKVKELQALQMHYDEERRRHEETIQQQQGKISELECTLQDTVQKRYSVIKSNNDSAGIVDEQGTGELRAQVQSLSQMLLKRQSTIVELQAERSALKSRVMDLESRCSNAEQQLAYYRDLEDDDGEGFADNDIRGGVMIQKRNKVDVGGFEMQSKAALRKRNQSVNDSAKVLHDLEKLGVKPNGGVGKAVTMIDTWALVTGRFLRHYPLVRLCFVLYLLVLHFWVLFILVVHTHSLELIDNPKDHIMNN